MATGRRRRKRSRRGLVIYVYDVRKREIEADDAQQIRDRDEYIEGYVFGQTKLSWSNADKSRTGKYLCLKCLLCVHVWGRLLRSVFLTLSASRKTTSVWRRQDARSVSLQDNYRNLTPSLFYTSHLKLIRIFWKIWSHTSHIGVEKWSREDTSESHLGVSLSQFLCLWLA